ncbi:unnamed protein product [Brassica oleracea var. botrytis]
MLLLFQDKDKKFLACENVPFKTQFIDMIALMRYNSWRIKDHSRLQTFSLKQLHDICYAIALTRHGEAFFKKIGKLSRESYMSIQDDHPKLIKQQMIVLTAGIDVERAYMQEKILDALEEGPLTCSVFMFPSYKFVRKDLVFEPTADGKLAFEKDNGCELDLHTMLLTGDGVDRKGKHYLEFQYSLDDIKNGDRGVLRFAVEPNTVAECVIFKDAYKLADWPSYEELKMLHKDENFRACENRIRDPSRLQTCALKQLRDICYTIALTRQAEAFFKQRGDLGRE